MAPPLPQPVGKREIRATCKKNKSDRQIAREGRLVPVRRRGKIVGRRRCFDSRLMFAACYGEPMQRYERKERAALEPAPPSSQPGSR